MKQFDPHFQSLKQKINLSEKEKYEILGQVNEKIARNRRISKRTFGSWKYVFSLVTTFTLIFIISLSIFQQETHTPTGDLHQVPSTLVGDVNESEEIVTQPLEEIIDEFLPPNSSLVSPEKPENIKAIQYYDFDKDGVAEAIVTYERKLDVEPAPSQFGVIVLQRKAGSWEKIWEEQTEGVGLEFSHIVDLTNDGTKELLFGVTIGASVGSQLKIYKWENQSLQLMDEMMYHQLEVVSNSRTGLAVWDRFLADAYLINVVTWDGEELVFDEEMFAHYYPTIKAFYEEKLAFMDAWYYWSALADAQIKANLLEEAKSSIQQGLILAEQLELTDAIESLQKLNEELEKKELS